MSRKGTRYGREEGEVGKTEGDRVLDMKLNIESVVEDFVRKVLRDVCTTQLTRSRHK